MIIFIFFWILFGIIDAGYNYCWYREKFPMLDKTSDTIFALISVLGGPITLLASLVSGQIGSHWKMPGT